MKLNNFATVYIDKTNYFGYRVQNFCRSKQPYFANINASKKWVVSSTKNVVSGTNLNPLANNGQFINQKVIYVSKRQLVSSTKQFVLRPNLNHL